MTSISRTVIIRGNFEEGNFGDDCLLAANILLLRQASREPVMLGPASLSAEADLCIPAATLSRLAGDGLILYGGGTQFFSDPMMQIVGKAPSLVKRLARLATDPMRLAASLRARATRTLLKRITSAAIGLGVGPFSKEAAQDESNVIELLRRMEFIWVRDPASAEFCRAHRLEHIESSDLCFSAPFLARFGSGPVREHSGGPVIGIVLSDHPALDDAFLRKIHCVSQTLRADGAEVQFISFSKRRDHFISILCSLGETVSSWDPETMPIASFRSFLAGHDAILTSRFHAGVFSVINQTPFAVIGVNHKMTSLVQRYQDANVPLLATTDAADRFAGTARSLLERPDDRRIALRRVFEAEIKVAACGVAALTAFLRSGHSGAAAA